MTREWLDEFMKRVQNTFGARVCLIGIQGSEARGEAGPDSDIDMVVVLDALTYGDVLRYREAVADLPDRARLCGFLSGRTELEHWDRADLVSFYFDTMPLFGSLAWMEALLTPEAVKRAVQTGACGLYHACVHNGAFERDTGVLRALYKSALFVLRTKHYRETGRFLRTKADLRQALTGADASIFALAADGVDETAFDAASRALLEWAGAILRTME